MDGQLSDVETRIRTKANISEISDYIIARCFERKKRTLILHWSNLVRGLITVFLYQGTSAMDDRIVIQRQLYRGGIDDWGD